MNKIRLFLNSIVFTVLTLNTSLATGISPLEFNGIFKCFKQPEFATNFGCLALPNLVSNIRFRMVKPGKDARGSRLWINDNAPTNDPVAALALLLFPSPAGSLTAVTSHPENIGRHLTVEDVAQLLNFCAHVRAFVSLKGGNRFGKNARKCIKRLIAAANKNLEPHDENYFSKFFEFEIHSHNTASRNKLRSLLKYTKQGRELIVALCKIIELEERTGPNEQFYPKFQAEQLLNAFFCLKFGREDITTLLDHLDDSIVDHEILPEDDLISVEHLECIVKKDSANITLDDYWALQNRDLVNQVIPYARGSKPINNGLARAYHRQTDQLTQLEYPDCTETFIRHLSNLILFSNLKIFDLTHAKDSAYLNNLEKFYIIQKPSKANSGEQLVRNSWSQVVGALGNAVRYRKKALASSTGHDAEIDPGIINIIRVLRIIYNLDLDAEPIYASDQQFAGDVTRWAVASLKKIFKLLDPTKKVIIDVSDVCPFIAFESDEYDCQGKIKIKVNEDFLSTMIIYSDHAEFDSIEILAPEEQTISTEVLETLAQKFSPAFQDNIGELLFFAHEKTKSNNAFYRLFQKSIEDSTHIIELLEQLLVMAQENAVSMVHAETILRTCLQMFLWQDHTMAQKIQLTLQKWTHFALHQKSINLQRVLQDEILTVQYELFIEYFDNNADDLLDFFNHAKMLYCDNIETEATEKVLLTRNHLSLESISFYYAGITNFEISGECPNLKNINLKCTHKLQSATLSGIFPRLENIDLHSSSMITSLKISGQCPALQTLELNYTFRLKEAIFLNECPKLQTQDPRIKFILFA